MIFGIGTDLVEIERIAKVLARHGDRFTGYILTDSEGAEAKRRGDSVQFIAGRWAAKEAVAKALGCGLGGRCAWRDIEVTGSASGAPVVTLSGDGARTMKENGIARVFVSISHEHGHAVAMAVAEKNDIPS